MPNRLAESTSPYLLQHKDNPVDWWPWCPEAFEEARRRDVPVLLSVGYAACHWCHVMAHESFEDDATAELVNVTTVPIKVDREERPDIDAVYMEATQAMTGQGGWPMTCFLTPAGEPFYCGTYFPREHFRQLLQAVRRSWTEQRDQVLEQGRRVVDALGAAAGLPAGSPLSADLLDSAARSLHAAYDAANGGFGGAPKFPPAMCLEFLLRHYARTGDERDLQIVEHTAERMARGGMYDQLAGGFARYSVDAGWVVPHFEKMLYDNALLLRLYLHLWRETGSPLARRIASETADFLIRDLRTPEGGLASSLDADADGVEGLTYVWTPDELRDVLGDDDGPWAAKLLGVGTPGNFEGDSSTLQMPADPTDPERWASVRERLLAARAARPQPSRDDKVVASWNGLAVAALAEAGVLLEREEYVAAARTAATTVIAVHFPKDRLVRASRAGVAGPSPGVLDDYGNFAQGLLTLHQATGDQPYLAVAGDLLKDVRDHFADPSGGFFDTADDSEALVRRPQDPTDNATPSGLSAAAGAFLDYAALAGSPKHRRVAEAALSRVAAIVAQHARFAGWAAAVGEALLAGPLEVAVATGPDGERTELARAARMGTSPGAVVVVGTPDEPYGAPLLTQRPLVAGQPTAYVCRGFVCAAPTTNAAELRRAVRTRQT